MIWQVRFTNRLSQAGNVVLDLGARVVRQLHRDRVAGPATAYADSSNLALHGQTKLAEVIIERIVVFRRDRAREVCKSAFHGDRGDGGHVLSLR